MELINVEEQKEIFENYFGFRESPFGVAPDPRFFYSSPPYLEGLAALVYGIRAKKGLMLLTGEVGTGKTILLRKLMRQLEPTVKFIFISSSHITSYGLVDLIVQDLGLTNREKNRLDMIHELNGYLTDQLKKGQTVTLLIDEGQSLSDDAMEGLCTLSNLETDQEKLLQIVLVGQPELATRLGKASLRRIKQRVAIHHRLYALQSIGEVEDYIRHRLQIAGYDGPEIFNKEAAESIWYYSGGTPRLINIICDNALGLACEASKKRVSAYMVMKAAGSLLLDRSQESAKGPMPDGGFCRAKTTAPKTGARRLDAFSSTVGPRRAASIFPDGVAQDRSAAGTVPAQFFEYMTRIAIAAMGPMAPLVLQDQMSALGEPRESFPQPKLKELIELVSREILNETMRFRFQEMMFQELEALNTARVG
jgi:general secretion pathway protein A